MLGSPHGSALMLLAGIKGCWNVSATSLFPKPCAGPRVGSRAAQPQIPRCNAEGCGRIAELCRDLCRTADLLGLKATFVNQISPRFLCTDGRGEERRTEKMKKGKKKGEKKRLKRKKGGRRGGRKKGIKKGI